jgi:hypothetical protein
LAARFCGDPETTETEAGEEDEEAADELDRCMMALSNITWSDPPSPPPIPRVVRLYAPPTTTAPERPLAEEGSDVLGFRPRLRTESDSLLAGLYFVESDPTSPTAIQQEKTVDTDDDDEEEEDSSHPADETKDAGVPRRLMIRSASVAMMDATENDGSSYSTPSFAHWVPTHKKAHSRDETLATTTSSSTCVGFPMEI